MFGEYALNEIFIERLDALICHSMCEYWGNRRDANMHDLAFHATSVLSMQGHDVKSKLTNPSGPKPHNPCGKLWLSNESGINAV